MFTSLFLKFVVAWLVLFPLLVGLFNVVGRSAVTEETGRLGIKYRTRLPKTLCNGSSRVILLINIIITMLGWMRYWDSYRLPSVMSCGWSMVAIWLLIVLVTAIFGCLTMEKIYCIGASIKKMFIAVRLAKFGKHHYWIDRTGTYITLPVDEYLGRKSHKRKKASKGDSKVVDIRSKKTKYQTSDREVK